MEQIDLAKKTGLFVSCLSLIERDKRDPSFSTIQKIASTLNIPCSFLFYLGADEDGLAEVDSELAERLVSTVFEFIQGENDV